MTVIAKRLGLIRVRRGGQYRVPQHVLVDEGNTKHRFENASLVSSLPMPWIQHIVFDLRAEIGADERKVSAQFQYEMF